MFVLLAPFVASAQDENPFIGIWDLDNTDSNFGSSLVPANMIRTYADAADGAFMYLLVTMNGDGSVLTIVIQNIGGLVNNQILKSDRRR